MNEFNPIRAVLKHKYMELLTDFSITSLAELRSKESVINNMDMTKVENKKTLNEDGFFMVLYSCITYMLSSPCTIESLTAFQKMLAMQLDAKTVNFAETKEAIKKMMIVVDEMILEYQES